MDLINDEYSRIITEYSVPYTKLEEYEESLVTRLVEQILIKDESVDVTLKSGEIITVEK